MEEVYRIDVTLDLAIPSRLLNKFDALVEQLTLILEISVCRPKDSNNLQVSLDKLTVSLKANASSPGNLEAVTVKSTPIVSHTSSNRLWLLMNGSLTVQSDYKTIIQNQLSIDKLTNIFNTNQPEIVHTETHELRIFLHFDSSQHYEVIIARSNGLSHCMFFIRAEMEN